VSRLAGLEEVLDDYLTEAPAQLFKALSKARGAAQVDILTALTDLRADAATQVVPLLEDPGFCHREQAISLLTWSRDPQIGDWLCRYALERVPFHHRLKRRRRALSPRRSSLPPDAAYDAVLRALRGHPSQRSESLLVLAAHDWDPIYRAAAVGSLGWWEPVLRAPVLLTLQETRRDPSPQVRQAARAALARLGERQALQGFRHALTGEDSQRVHEMIQLVANEGLTLLWPDLDRLADAEDLDIAHHAREALARLGEDLGRLPRR
jgi:hypothetical protein